MSPDKLNKRKDFMISILGFLDLSSQLLLHFYFYLPESVKLVVL